MKVCVLGLGYIGFPTALLVAQAGHEVVGVDINPAVVDRLRRGESHIVNEMGLAELAHRMLREDQFRVSTRPESADVFIIAVPTPIGAEQGVAGPKSAAGHAYHADLSYVIAATESLAPVVTAGNLVILESTVPPGTTEQVVRQLRDAGVDVSQLLFAHAPERVLPGNILKELVENDRIIGALSPAAGSKAADFYRSFVTGQVLVTDSTTAELVKLMENTFRDVNIALANEFALVCEQLNVDVWEAIRLANLHPRVNILRPGPGVGGHCIAVDPYFVIEVAPHSTELIQAARAVNRNMPHHVMTLFDRLMGDITVRKVAVLGASYKAEVGDERESPSLEIVSMLREKGFSVMVHDPYVERFAVSLEEVLRDADVIMHLTSHRQYRELVPAWVGALVRNHLIFDAHGVLNANTWRDAGFRVVRLGVGGDQRVGVSR